MKEAGDIFRCLENAESIAIAGHINPDGDSIGACFAMALGLHKLGKKPYVLMESYSERFDIIPGGKFVYKGDVGLLKPDVFLCLDCASADRLGAFKNVFNSCGTTVNIDHHTSNTMFADINLVVPHTSSTCELVFGLMNMYLHIDSDIAAALYAGILFDTGGFRHQSTGTETHNVAARLLSVGFDHSGLYNELMYVHSQLEARCFGAALARMVIVDEGRIAASHIDYETLKSLNATGKDLEGTVEYLMGIRGVMAAVFVYAVNENEVKISFRSKSLDVSEIAKLYGGGGHVNAAGCNVPGKTGDVLTEAIKRVRDRLQNA